MNSELGFSGLGLGLGSRCGVGLSDSTMLHTPKLFMNVSMNS